MGVPHVPGCCDAPSALAPTHVLCGCHRGAVTSVAVLRRGPLVTRAHVGAAATHPVRLDAAMRPTAAADDVVVTGGADGSVAILAPQ